MIAVFAFALLWFAIPETRSQTSASSGSDPEMTPTSTKQAFAK